jgi:hypothetical protein
VEVGVPEIIQFEVLIVRGEGRAGEMVQFVIGEPLLSRVGVVSMREPTVEVMAG